jgi:hypothetical protein
MQSVLNPLLMLRILRLSPPLRSQPAPMFSPFAPIYQYIPPFNPIYPLIVSSPLQSLPPARPASALATSYSEPTISKLPPTSTLHPLHPLNLTAHYGSLSQQSTINILEREQGKGDRAPRISHHLRMSSKNRSTSPPSHRFPLPRSSPAGASAPSQLLSPAFHRESEQLAELAVSLPLHSPCPLLSPKVSRSSLRSERVEELERMAAEEVLVRTGSRRKKKSLRKGKEKEVVPPDFNKTLPPPPVPTRKSFPLSTEDAVSAYTNLKRTKSAPRATKLPKPAPAHQTPPTPTLTAVTPVRHACGNEAGERTRCP